MLGYWQPHDNFQNWLERVSYSYADVLTKTVQLTIFPPTGGDIKIACA
jgi:uncharacterized protein Veg